MENSTRTGLLIVNLQVGFLPMPRLVSNIQKERKNHAVTAMTRFTNPSNSFFRSVLGFQDEGGELLLPTSDAVILDTPGIGLSLAQIHILQSYDCTQWHICGIDTHGGLMGVAHSMWEADLHPLFRPNLCQGLPIEILVGAQRQLGDGSPIIPIHKNHASRIL